MRRVKRSALVSLVVGVCHVIAGCGDSEEGSGGRNGTTGTDATSGTTDGSTTTTTTTTASSSSTGGDGGGGGGMGDPCEPTDGADIPVTCGIFVDSNADAGGNGQQDTPYNTLAEALAQAGGANNRIYVCGSLVEALTVPEGLAIHGDVTCERGWQWDFSQRTRWEALADQIPLHFVGGTTPTVITGFAIESRDAEAIEGSSIAVIAEGGTLSLVRTDVIAGDAAGGQPGVSGAAGGPGGAGAPGGDAFGEFGGLGAASTCGGATGGAGAYQSCMINMMGNCVPSVITQSTLNPNGGGVTGAGTCTDGDVGTPGAAGAAGADATGIGSIGANGFTNTAGGPGDAGGTGGPGGGGGAKTNPTNWGGGGGAGGCGSAGSTGGTSGGASIAFISLNATILFDDATASVGLGGNGGAGGASTPGGAGGAGGVGGCDTPCITSLLACDGGTGGPGGAGGSGGNGAGGHALIIAYTGIQNPLDGLTAEAPVNQGGLAGGGNASQGQSAVELEFP